MDVEEQPGRDMVNRAQPAVSTSELDILLLDCTGSNGTVRVADKPTVGGGIDIQARDCRSCGHDLACFSVSPMMSFYEVIFFFFFFFFFQFGIGDRGKRCLSLLMAPFVNQCAPKVLPPKCAFAVFAPSLPTRLMSWQASWPAKDGNVVGY